MNLQNFLITIILGLLIIIAYTVAALIGRIKSIDREAESAKETFGPVNCRCGPEDIGIRIHWEYSKLENNKKWVGMVNGTERFVIHRPKNSDDYRLWLFNGKMIGSYETIFKASAEAEKIANFMSYYFDGD